MIVTAEHLIEKLDAKYSAMVQNICILDKTCLQKKRCSTSQRYPLLNFDKIKDSVYRGKKTPPSVDGLLAHKGVLCFVELKSWENFLHYQHPQTVDDIQFQLSSFKLKDKLEYSMSICVTEAENEKLFLTIPVAFIVVTDIDVETNGWGSFVQNMESLSQTASDWEVLCNEFTKEYLKNMCDVTTIYVTCKQFDNRISEIR